MTFLPALEPQQDSIFETQPPNLLLSFRVWSPGKLQAGSFHDSEMLLFSRFQASLVMPWNFCFLKYVKLPSC